MSPSLCANGFPHVRAKRWLSQMVFISRPSTLFYFVRLHARTRRSQDEPNEWNLFLFGQPHRPMRTGKGACMRKLHCSEHFTHHHRHRHHHCHRQQISADVCGGRQAMAAKWKTTIEIYSYIKRKIYTHLDWALKCFMASRMGITVLKWRSVLLRLSAEWPCTRRIPAPRASTENATGKY